MTTNGNDIVKTAISRRGIPVKCLETGATYKNAYQAAKAFNANASNVSKCCQGKRKSINGMHFEYTNDALTTEPATETDSHIITIQNEARLDVLGHRINRNCKSVTVKELNKSFDSLTETAEALGVSVHAVSSALCGRTGTVAGYHVYLTSEAKEHMEEQQDYNRAMLAAYEELKKEMEPYLKWKKEQELARKEEEERKQKLEKLEEKLARRKRIVDRKESEWQQAVVRYMETEKEIKELKGE